jgi:hypothetical protein
MMPLRPKERVHSAIKQGRVSHYFPRKRGNERERDQKSEVGTAAES